MPSSADAESSSAHRRHRGWAAVAAVVSLVCVAGLAGWWASTAHALSAYGGGGASGQIQRGQTYYAGLEINPAEGSDSVRLDITSLRVRIVHNTSAATVRLLVCTPKQTDHLGASDTIAPYCKVSGFGPGSRTIGPARPYFVVAITPTRAGRVDIEGADVTYWQGIRHGSQHAGIALTAITG